MEGGSKEATGFLLPITADLHNVRKSDIESRLAMRFPVSVAQDFAFGKTVFVKLCDCQSHLGCGAVGLLDGLVAGCLVTWYHLAPEDETPKLISSTIATVLTSCF